MAAASASSSREQFICKVSALRLESIKQEIASINMYIAALNQARELEGFGRLTDTNESLASYTPFLDAMFSLSMTSLAESMAAHAPAHAPRAAEKGVYDDLLHIYCYTTLLRLEDSKIEEVMHTNQVVADALRVLADALDAQAIALRYDSRMQRAIEAENGGYFHDEVEICEREQAPRVGCKQLCTKKARWQSLAEGERPSAPEPDAPGRSVDGAAAGSSCSPPPTGSAKGPPGQQPADAATLGSLVQQLGQHYHGLLVQQTTEGLLQIVELAPIDELAAAVRGCLEQPPGAQDPRPSQPGASEHSEQDDDIDEDCDILAELGSMRSAFEALVPLQAMKTVAGLSERLTALTQERLGAFFDEGAVLFELAESFDSISQRIHALSALGSLIGATLSKAADRLAGPAAASGYAQLYASAEQNFASIQSLVSSLRRHLSSNLARAQDAVLATCKASLAPQTVAQEPSTSVRRFSEGVADVLRALDTDLALLDAATEQLAMLPRTVSERLDRMAARYAATAALASGSSEDRVQARVAKIAASLEAIDARIAAVASASEQLEPSLRVHAELATTLQVKSNRILSSLEEIAVDEELLDKFVELLQYKKCSECRVCSFKWCNRYTGVLLCDSCKQRQDGDEFVRLNVSFDI